jgi:phosphopantothenoylcysteine decarboxylase / phosphopantothenate---cysteine ligase
MLVTEVPDALRGLRIAVMVSGGIAAYKVAALVSSLAQAGCELRVAMTGAAQRFVGPATFHGLSGQPVLTDLWAGTGAPEPHVELGDWAQLILVAPATASTLARLAQGLATDPVSATVLAARCPIVVAPAMNDAMWAKSAVAANVAALRGWGWRVVEPEHGHLASGHAGKGRLPEPDHLLDAMADAWHESHELAGMQVVVTAGGTREPIDPVRFIGNLSSGKMGYALAVVAAERGAQVTLVTTASHEPRAGVRLVSVTTAVEMLACLRRELVGANLFFMVAAVADFRVAEVSEEKIRREDRGELTLHLVENIDVLGELAQQPGLDGLYRVGFAAEGAGLEAGAAAKLARKKLDAIVANDIRGTDTGFGADDNAGLLLFGDGSRIELERMSKRAFAGRIVDAITPRLKSPESSLPRGGRAGGDPNRP